MKAERERRTGAVVEGAAHWEEKRKKKERTNPSLVEGVAADKAPRSSALFAWLSGGPRYWDHTAFELGP